VSDARQRLAGVVALACAFAGGDAAAQRPGAPPPVAPPTPAAARTDTSRDGLDGDPDPVGAVIERRALLRLSDAQFVALRDLRRWHQRSVRLVRDSLDKLGARDSVRTWTLVARDSARAILTPAQRDSLVAVWSRYRDSLPARTGRPRGRPPA
jgi:hypothetical protein